MQSELVDLEKKLRNAQLRPTKQRLALAQLLYADGDRHITAERLHSEAIEAGVAISLATIYNNLHQFTSAGLLREVVVDSSRSYFDTNIAPHHHFFHEQTGKLEDIAVNDLKVDNIPPLPEGMEISSVDVIVRVNSSRR
ncbi:iron response transcriptional regulator IrrA [Sneathiella litorea]|uniref:Ferric uptake regulation protein n=1 Tax=Sneathiella litorea TaxID=2606216 RepID=A0A6L8W547_9PROT|nr:Fur family transcriptional regulator [Sneathiella litorea]MZR29603.1 transcriptional repressor [Sneathiella litorea]